MRLSGLDLASYRSYSETSIEFPERGLVLFLGDNGTGKSSVPEALLWGLWDQTTRGGNPQRGGLAEVTVRLEDRHVRRVRKGNSRKIGWRDPASPADAKWQVAATPTETQAAVERAVGHATAFLHSCLFSADLLDTFTRANDRARKQLIERLTGLAALADAETRARRDRPALVESTGARDRGVAAAQARLQEAARATQGLMAERPDPAALAALRGGVEQAEATLADARERAARASAEVQGAEVRWREARERARRARDERAAAAAAARSAAEQEARARRQVEAAGSLSGTCGVCRRPVTPKVREDVVRAATTELEEARAVREAADHTAATALEASSTAVASETRAEEDGRRLRAAAERLRSEVAEADRALGVAKERLSASEDAARQARDRVEGARAAARAARLDMEEAERGAEAARRELSVHDAAVQLLSPKGVRARLLEARLASLGAATTRYLRRIGLPWTIALSPTTENQDGGERESISIRVKDGSDYEDASSGERRRIDVAVLLALAEMAEAWAGAPARLPLFLDEVFDTLDRRGCEAVAELLREFAERRPVVVITHSADLRDWFRPDQVWRFSGGQRRAPTRVQRAR